MNGVIDVALIGIGGYGAYNLELVRQLQGAGRVRLAAVIDPMAEKSPHWPGLMAEGIPSFPTLAEFKRAGVAADLAVISSPIAFHAEQSCEALAMGMNVLCEKPMAATIEDAYRMRAVRDASGKFLEIGYQWSFSRAIQDLKRDILAGRLGAPLRLLTSVGWPRTSAYYGRNTWAGRLRDDAGRWVLDSPVNNATAHYLHNMLYVIGPALERSATPVAITAECYRANPIENYDAACCRVETREKAEILFFTAHCVQEEVGPVFRFIFENATVEYKPRGNILARFSDGREADYGNPDLDPVRKVMHCVEQCTTGAAANVCGPEAALAHTLCVNAMQDVPIHNVDPKWIERLTHNGGETLTFVPGLSEAIRLGGEQGRLFSEMQLPWACPAVRIPLADHGG
jgi:predicted dehydrogenase